MADLQSELEYKLRNHPNVRYKMLKHLAFHTIIQKMTEEQMDLMESILDDKVRIVFVNAKSGTGKTLMAVAAAYAMYLNDKNREMIYVAAPVAEDILGHTPGSPQAKAGKYMSPLTDALLELNLFPDQVIRNEDLIEEQKETEVWCNATTHAYMRGSNIKDKTLIIDEPQNNTRGELKKILTRVHDSSKTIVIGHDGQIDLKDPRKSGFVPYLEHFKDEPYAKVHELHHNFRGLVAQKADELSWE